MPNQYLLIILLVICVFILFGILLIIRLFSRQKLPSNNTQHSIPVKKSVQSVSTIPIRGVFTRLNFFESLDPKLFEKASKQCVEEWIKTEPLSNAGDGVSMTINTIPRLVGSSVEMTVSASSKGQMLFKEGRALIPIHNASGNELPVLKDTVSGKIIENMKGHRGVNTLTKLGAISAVIIGAAHIIAGADISKKLKIINAKIDQILAYRHIDQMAILERIYTSAQEICISSWNEQSKCKELWSLRGELRELRITWRGEFSHRLQLIDDPAEEHWFKRMFTTQKKSDSKISAEGIPR